MPPRPATALDAALAALARREVPAPRLAERLRSAGFRGEEVDLALARVRELGYLDDSRTAVRAAERALAQGYSARGAIARLEAQGVDPSVAAAAVHDVLREKSWSDETIARSIITARRLSGPRAARFLAARGFDEELIRRVVSLPD